MEGRRTGRVARLCQKWKRFFRHGCCANPWSIPLASSSSSTVPAAHGEIRSGVHPDDRQNYLRGDDQFAPRVDGAPMVKADSPTAARVTLESLLRLGEGGEGEEEKEREQEEDADEAASSQGGLTRSPGSGWWCCVCMRRRKKGAAFISCGHTFCRDCARELHRRRGACPLCNRVILDILDIF